MKEKILCNCSNNFMADTVVDILKRNGINFRQHNETNEPHSGFYGPNPGITIFVIEEDYKKALILVEPVINTTRVTTLPFCPKCGSEDVKHIERSRFITPLLLLSIILFIAPLVYLHYAKGSGNQIMYYLSIFTFISSIVIVIVCSRMDANYKCNHCGKKFNRR
ncbi:hypothetical protein [Phocaeicola vulgatus]|uniref:hypothetical protein n=1 Tax=Phocaeicola vulgatus TaxID=821 RepID=UPI003DA2F19E